MSEPITFAPGMTQEQLQTMLRGALAGVAPAVAAPAPQAAPAPAAWGALAARPTMGVPPAQGVAVPLKIELRDGSSVKPLLFFGPEWAGADALPQLLDALAAAGAPLDAWRPKNDGGYGGGGRGGYNRGGYQR